MTRVSAELVTFTAEHWDGDTMWQEYLRYYGHALPWSAEIYGSHAEARRALEAAGSHYYDRDAVRFFNAGTPDAHMAAGSFWIESRRFESDPREYQVAYVTRNGHALSVEKFAPVTSLAEARKIRSTLARLVKAHRENV